MKLSDNIAALADSLSKAQGAGDRDRESAALRDFMRSCFPGRTNGSRMRPLMQKFLSKVAFGASDCWYWIGARHKLGYGLMTVPGESKAHRISWRLFHGDIPEGLCVCHRCDIRSCVNPDHLFLGTQQENVLDMVAKGRQVLRDVSGSRNPQSKITPEIVAEMKRMRRDGMVLWRIAEHFGVATMTAQRAIVGTSWKEI